MGNYIESADIIQRTGNDRLEKLANNADDQAQVLTDCITHSEAHVDAFVGQRYETPVPASGFIQELTLRIAEYELYRRSQGAVVPDRIKNAYDDALEMLRDIAAGDMGIGGSTAPTILGGDTGSIAVESDDPIFTADALEGTGW